MMARRSRCDLSGYGGISVLRPYHPAGRGCRARTGSSGWGPRDAGRHRDRPFHGGFVQGGTWKMTMVVDWPSLAACRNGDPDALFVQGAEQNVAKRICRGCPVRYECLADALDNRIEFGAWGGMTERERRALLRRHPNVTSWPRMFEAAIKQK